MNKFKSYKLILFILIIGLASISIINIKSPVKNIKEVPAKAEVPKNIDNELPVVGTFENFKKLVEEGRKQSEIYGGVMRKGDVMFTEAAKDGVQNNTKSKAPSSDYSKTNVQVEGVDEGDVVKTDGKYIYQVNNQKVVIAKAYPAEDMKIISTVGFADKNFYPLELYVDDSHLVVLGTSYSEHKYDVEQKNSKDGSTKKIPYYYSRNTVRIIVYDIKNKESIKELRQAEIEGHYVSSRKIGSKLYTISNKFIEYHIMDKGIGEITPFYKDSASSNEQKVIGYDRIRYFPDTPCDNSMIIGAMDVSTQEEMKVETYLGAGQNIYASNDNLYIAITKYGPQPYKNEGTADKKILPEPYYPMEDPNTLVYKFSFNNGDVKYAAKGEVPGTILNQFSMDEYDNHFRIATTNGQVWGRGENISKNNIYILDSSMKLAGKIEDIAPGERIYSARFMGEKGYLVTFEKVDPLFVIDLKDNKNPKILGALKIPGYSDYLHPYDENHIIGFGKDTIVLPVKDGKGNVIDEQAYYLGMKVSIFDVTDVNKPVEMFVTTIGDRGTNSEILQNHKALLFSKYKNLLAFPVNLYELREGQDKVNSQHKHPEYGTFTFQGAYIYNIDLEKGLTLKGRITHITDDEYNKSGKYHYNGFSNVERILYIDNTLYTLSKNKIKASNLDNLSSKGEVIISQDEK